MQSMRVCIQNTLPVNKNDSINNTACTFPSKGEQYAGRK
ncbi:hypothetical protein DDI_0787 [Dickeya dianthicola RNS04.9]|nr:hypothetical protein DDI_0787 [Dickeya dianthicola RNS04.9]